MTNVESGSVTAAAYAVEQNEDGSIRYDEYTQLPVLGEEVPEFMEHFGTSMNVTDWKLAEGNHEAVTADNTTLTANEDGYSAVLASSAKTGTPEEPTDILVSASIDGRQSTAAVPYYYIKKSAFLHYHHAAGDILDVAVDEDTDATQLAEQTDSKDGYVFRGWSKTENATAAEYEAALKAADLEKFVQTGGTEVDLYPVFRKTAVIRYHHANGETAEVAVDEDTDVTQSAEQTDSKDGYVFRGWSETENATAAEYEAALKAADLEKFVQTGGTEVDLYPVFRKTAVIRYHHANGETAEVAVDEDTDVTQLAEQTDAKEGYVFRGWSETENATAAEYEAALKAADLEKFVQTGGREADLYPVLRKTAIIRYHHSDGEIVEITVDEDTDVTQLAEQTDSKDGYNFRGWSAEENNRTAEYDSVLNDTDLEKILQSVSSEIDLYPAFSQSSSGSPSSGGSSKPKPADPEPGNTDPGKTDPGTVNPEPSEPVPSNQPTGFIDVPADSWMADAVRFVAGKKLFIGTSANTFSPADSMTRGMLMTVLARMDGVNTENASPWYQKGLEWAMAKGVSDGTRPEEAITREQLATMLYRYAGKPSLNGSLDRFRDADSVSDWAEDAMIWATQTGIIIGNNDTVTLDPQGLATRAQVATMIQRYVGYMTER